MSQNLILPGTSTLDRIRALDGILELAGDVLDLPPSKHQDAISKYEAVGNFLGQPGTLVAPFDPLIYAQGSLSYGTCVKPVGEEEFDLDLVCLLRNPGIITQREAKNLIGRRLKEDSTYIEMVEEKNRCWRLNYAGNFHLDILPAKPDSRTDTAILVPDKGLKTWKPSNPKGFCEWFLMRSATSMTEVTKAQLAEAKAEVEDPPEYDCGKKSPLQRAVQILKRHRNLAYQDRRQDFMPISAIITTLGAKAYSGENSILQTMKRIVRTMCLHTQRDRYGRAYVLNPTHPEENYADKWHADQRYEIEFNAWIDKVSRDIEALENATGRTEIAGALERIIGSKRTKLVFEAEANGVNRLRTKSSLQAELATGILTSASSSARTVPRNTFFGK